MDVLTTGIELPLNDHVAQDSLLATAKYTKRDTYMEKDHEPACHGDRELLRFRHAVDATSAPDVLRSVATPRHHEAQDALELGAVVAILVVFADLYGEWCWVADHMLPAQSQRLMQDGKTNPLHATAKDFVHEGTCGCCMDDRRDAAIASKNRKDEADFAASDCKVLIMNGELLSGIVCKKTVRARGGCAGGRFSCGVADIIANDQTLLNVEKTLKQVLVLSDDMQL
eukprot:Skav202938  [mRNA]  locus=scaffold422:158274:163808:+ [translate_table: standard]